MHGFGMWGMGPWMWLGWILILGAIIWVVYATTRKSTQSPHSVRELTSQGILERRYARGEISSTLLPPYSHQREGIFERARLRLVHHPLLRGRNALRP